MLNHHRIKVYWFLSHLIMLEQTNTNKNGQNLCKYSRKHSHFCFKWMLTVEKKIRYVSLYLIFAFSFKMTAAYKYLQSVFLMLNQTTTHNFKSRSSYTVYPSAWKRHTAESPPPKGGWVTLLMWSNPIGPHCTSKSLWWLRLHHYRQ